MPASPCLYACLLCDSKTHGACLAHLKPQKQALFYT